MPYLSFTVERMGGAEQFVANLSANIPTALAELTAAIKDDIAMEAPPRRVYNNPKAGDVKLSESFSSTPAEQTGEFVWESYIKSSVPAKARALEYGSGLQGTRASKYPIVPIMAQWLHFYWEKAPAELGGPGWYKFKHVSHPGVPAFGYIRKVLEYWREPIKKRFGEAIQMSAVKYQK